jgi:hypothetical protein
MPYPDPIAYTYDGDYHCPDCALEEWGRGPDGFIGTSNRAADEVDVVAPWDEWLDPYEAGVQTLNCGTCYTEIDRYEPEIDADDLPDEEDM